MLPIFLLDTKRLLTESSSYLFDFNRNHSRSRKRANTDNASEEIRIIGWDREFRRIQLKFKLYKTKHRESRQRRHYMRYKANDTEELVPFVDLDYLDPAIQEHLGHH